MCDGAAFECLSFAWPSCPPPETKLTKHGTKRPVEALKSCHVLCLKYLSCNNNLVDFDNSHSDEIKRRYYITGNETLLQCCRAQVRICRCVAAVAVLRTA